MFPVGEEENAMKTKIHVTAVAVGLCVAGVAALLCRNRKKNTKPVQTPETAEDQFLSEWTAVLREDARVFNGLFDGLHRVRSGTAKKPEKVLREWCQRTHYKWENEAVDLLCQDCIVPLTESADREALIKWAGLLLEAAAAAGIAKETAERLVLTEENADDYIEWDGEELSVGDTVEIITPAWYQNGSLLEQGQCRKDGNGEAKS